MLVIESSMASHLSLHRAARNTAFRWALVLGVAGFGAGCNVATTDETVAVASKNECNADQLCGAGVCLEGMCQSPQSELKTLLLEITPPSGVKYIAGVRFNRVLENFALSDGPLDIVLGHVSRINGRVSAAPVEKTICVLAEEDAVGPAFDGTLPVRVTFVPRERVLGLPNPPQTREITPLEESSTYDFSLSIPPGSYDIYVEPLSMDGECIRPPHLLVDQEIAAGDIALNLNLPEPAHLEVVVRWPGEVDALGGWMIDIVERDSGRRLSNRATLDASIVSGGLFEYTAGLAFSEVAGDASMPSTELVRLSPPAGVTAPTVYFERSVVQLFQDGKGVIDQLEALPSPVRFSGRVNRTGTSKPARATVTLNAIQLEQVSPGTIALFSRTVETDEEGGFTAELLPGTYSVLATPLEPGLAAATSSLVVSATGGSQGGKVIEVDEQQLISGKLVAFDGAGLEGIPVESAPPPVAPTRNVFELVSGGLSRLPRADADISSGEGQFSLLADAGIYHVVARPEPSTGFAWGFALGVEVNDVEADLGVLPLTLPYVLRGFLSSSDTGTAVGNALIRAYAYLDEGELTSKADEATSAIAVGEARVDETGAFRLLLPSRLP